MKEFFLFIKSMDKLFTGVADFFRNWKAKKKKEQEDDAKSKTRTYRDKYGD